MSSIHGHEVLQMMIDSGESFTTEQLIAAIEKRFGSAARFHTCSATDMTAAALVQFLADRGKFIPSEAGFTTSASKICQH
ncbi:MULTISPECIES: YecH family metal-binding protein [unclassified Brenneria]|uniref:YecH family metal-binding protein n=1 Tax=unclassified Brenneria TaxID=2634434 RepID=UPI0029C19976|nr:MULTISPECIES: YecH family metal-binding protein [unclassified Brenneria]MDX5626448.1 YecH family protein [Brenneria sp. L3-3Z]MDX5694202.1 YecH family protein [Brenneria sp. L4-2C]MEE3662568.1 YecH family metal-binding protein [Brenneria sp. g21c3]